MTLNFGSALREHDEVTASPENWKKSLWFKALLGEASDKEEIQNTTVPRENTTLDQARKELMTRKTLEWN